MLQIKKNEIEDFDSPFQEQLVDYMILTSFIWKKLKTQYGKAGAVRILIKILFRIAKEE